MWYTVSDCGSWLPPFLRSPGCPKGVRGFVVVRYNRNMDILGGVVLLDAETGKPYRPADSVLSSSENFGVGILGSVVLIDPETGLSYNLEEE